MNVRTATGDDLDAVLELEQFWPENQRASRDLFAARLEKFPQGFFVAMEGEKLVSTFTSCPINYDPASPHRLGTWHQVTNGGMIRSLSEVPGANALYAVSGIIHPEHRAGGVMALMIGAAVDAARRLGLDYYIAGAVIPSYKSYCMKHGEISAADYVFTKKGSRLVDPFLEQYRRSGFIVPDRAHVLANYYADEGSDNYAALVVKEVLPA